MDKFLKSFLPKNLVKLKFELTKSYNIEKILKFLSNTDLKTLELKCKENKEVE
jgi:hypothetical protein